MGRIRKKDEGGGCLRSKRSRTSGTEYQAARRSFRIRDARKMGREEKGRGRGVGEGKVPLFPLPHPPPSSFFLSPHFPRVPNAKTSRGLIFPSARTRTLATQAIRWMPKLVSYAALTSQSLRATVGPLQDN